MNDTPHAVEPSQLRRILIVDDEPSILKYLGLCLSEEGYQVTSARSGKEALTYLDQLTFDVVLTDCNMPEMCGLEMAAKIKKRFSSLPIILMSGHPVDDFELNNFIGFLAKPFNQRRLLEALDLASC